MATIHKLSDRERPTAATAPRALRAHRTAEIVIFPGVRYEYWKESSADAGQAVERDRLDPGE
jgi:hypothetical protein